MNYYFGKHILKNKEKMSYLSITWIVVLSTILMLIDFIVVGYSTWINNNIYNHQRFIIHMSQFVILGSKSFIKLIYP